MKKYFWIVLLLPLAGCFFTQDRLGGPDPNLKPYGAHWIKDGMTRESRRNDSWTCGAANTVIAADSVVFSKEQIAAAKLPSDKDEFFGSNERLTKQWGICMKSKGYTYLDQCDARCLYP